MASEIHPFVSGFGPTNTTVDREVRGASEQSSYATDFTFKAGAEFLAGTEFAPFYFGGGVGLVNAQKSQDLEITPWGAPIWASLSLRSSKSFDNCLPFVTMRGGWVLPLSTAGAWWNAPKNYMVDAVVGVIYQKSIGIEIGLAHAGFKKSFKNRDVSYRFSSNRFGITFFMNFELTHTQDFVPNEEFHPEDEETEDHQVNTPVIKEISSAPVEEKEPAEEATATEEVLQ